LTIIIVALSDLTAQELSVLLTPFDLKRLDSYANNMLDYHVILDMLPTVASLYFQKRLQSGRVSGDVDVQPGDGPLRLGAVQSSILLALGLQRKTIEDLEVCLLSWNTLDQCSWYARFPVGRAPTTGLADPCSLR